MLNNLVSDFSKINFCFISCKTFWVSTYDLSDFDKLEKKLLTVTLKIGNHPVQGTKKQCVKTS